MRLPTRTGRVLAVAAIVVALPTAAGALPTGANAPTAVSANSTTFQDSTGEDPAAADMGTIVVSNDDAGMITFRFEIPNRPTYQRETAIFLTIDSDANQATGDPDQLGADFSLDIFAGEAILFRWTGTGYQVAANQASLSYSWQSGPTIRINAADLNNTRRFNFSAQTASGIIFDPTTGAPSCPPAPADCARDFAPTFGFYNYNVVITPPTLVVRGLKATPAAPRAGRPFTLRLTVARSDTGAAIQSGRVTCVGRVGTARLRADLARVQGGAVVCIWSIPANARGKTFRGTVTVVHEGLRATRSFTARVR